MTLRTGRLSTIQEELRKLVPNYKPSVHQLAVTRRIDVAALRVRSDSFDKLVRDLAALSEATPPPRGRA